MWTWKGGVSGIALSGVTFNFSGEKPCFSLSQRCPQSVIQGRAGTQREAPRLPPRPFPDRGRGHCSPASCTRRLAPLLPKALEPRGGPPLSALGAQPAPGRSRGPHQTGTRRGTHEPVPTTSRRKQTGQAPAAAHKVAFDRPFRSKLSPFPQENKCK